MGDMMLPPVSEQALAEARRVIPKQPSAAALEASASHKATRVTARPPRAPK